MSNRSESYAALSNAVNNFNFDTKAFIMDFKNDHRYLQNEVFRLAMAIVAECASDDYKFDVRNAPAHSLAKKIQEAVPDVAYFKAEDEF